MEKRVVFRNNVLPYVLVAPQIVITLVFFIWPASQALLQSFLQEDAFGTSSTFVWFENFADIFTSQEYLGSFRVTLVFSLAVAGSALSVALHGGDGDIFFEKRRHPLEPHTEWPPGHDAGGHCGRLA
ncbi:MAG: hypothetical protein MUC33_10925 [Desulfobacterales bacterium]|nr:hypothetical protein [Desulfobacterales bacterium]